MMRGGRHGFKREPVRVDPAHLQPDDTRHPSVRIRRGERMTTRRFERIRRAFAAAATLLVVSSLALLVNAKLDPARLETWKLPKASLFGVASHGDKVWACGYWGTLLRSQDGGKTWTQSDTPT